MCRDAPEEIHGQGTQQTDKPGQPIDPLAVTNLDRSGIPVCVGSVVKHETDVFVIKTVEGGAFTGSDTQGDPERTYVGYCDECDVIPTLMYRLSAKPSMTDNSKPANDEMRMQTPDPSDDVRVPTPSDLRAADVEIALLPQPSHHIQHLHALYYLSQWLHHHLGSFSDIVQQVGFDDVLIDHATKACVEMGNELKDCLAHASQFHHEITNEAYRYKVATLAADAGYAPVQELRDVMTTIKHVHDAYYEGLAARENRELPRFPWERAVAG